MVQSPDQTPHNIFARHRPSAYSKPGQDGSTLSITRWRSNQCEAIAVNGVDQRPCIKRSETVVFMRPRQSDPRGSQPKYPALARALEKPAYSGKAARSLLSLSR